jgi:hypothetical protein
MTTITSGTIQYSGRRGRNEGPPRSVSPVSRIADAPSNSPAWWMALTVLVVVALSHGIWLGIAVTAGQLALMTALQWGVIVIQRRHTGGRPLRTLPMLRAARWASFLAVIIASLLG